MSYKEADYLKDTPKRGMGSETEYTIDYIPPFSTLSYYLPNDIEHFEERCSDGEGKDIWLGNGGRLYLESDHVIEYATPIVDSAVDLLTHERAGEKIVDTYGQNVRHDASENGYRDRVAAGAYKRTGYAEIRDNLSPKILVLAEESVGHHENYFTPLAVILEQSSTPYMRLSLSAYFATRPVWSGSGMVTAAGYELSQKASAINFRGTSHTTHGNKMPYAGYPTGRFENRTGEGNMAEWAIIQKYAMTSLVLRLIEHRKFPEKLMLDNPDATSSMRAMSKRQAIKTRTKFMSATEHQRLIAQACLDFAESWPEIPYEEIHAAEEVIRVCNDIDLVEEDWSGVSIISDRVDWAAKRDLMQLKGMTNRDILAGNHEAVKYDLMWESVAANGIARVWYAYRGQNSRIVPAEVDNAIYEAPTNSSSARIQVLRSLDSTPLEISWAHIQTEDREYRFDNPLDPMSKIAV